MIESIYSEMKNNTTKSVILAPFNSTISDFTKLDSIPIYERKLFMPK